ncbi:hypothetical protein PFISCL1PPCAC_12677, partial [Pristionchus fissidentatus]
SSPYSPPVLPRFFPMGDFLLPRSFLQEFYLQQDEQVRIHSISGTRLNQVINEWSCATTECPRNLMGFGPYRDLDPSATPYSLRCGHYLCGLCRSKLMRNKSGYKCERIDCSDDCLEMTADELRGAPVAAHILKLVPLLRPQGIKCEGCPLRLDRDWSSIRYPSEMMVAYYDDQAEEGKKYLIPFAFEPELDDDSDGELWDVPTCKWRGCLNKPEEELLRIALEGEEEYKGIPVRKKKKIEEPIKASIFCKMCALNIAADLDERLLSLEKYSEWEFKVPREFRNHIYYLMKPEKNICKVSDRNREDPWHLWLLSPSQMTPFLDELLACPCKKVYTPDNHPVMLSCGHHCCILCEHEILSKRSRCAGNGGLCNGPEHVKTERQPPRDLTMLIALRTDTMRTCVKCARLHDPEHFIPRPTQNGRDVDICCFCAAGIHLPARQSTQHPPVPPELAPAPAPKPDRTVDEILKSIEQNEKCAKGAYNELMREQLDRIPTIVYE